MQLDKRTISIAVCAIGTLATAGVAQSHIGVRSPKGEEAITLDVRSEAAARKLVAYLKGSKASYYLEQGSKGKSSKLASGSISMSDLQIVKQKLPKWRTPGKGGDGPIATNANNGVFADAGHVAVLVWGAADSGIAGKIGSVLKGVDAGLYRADIYQKGLGKTILGKKIGTLNAGGLKAH